MIMIDFLKKHQVNSYALVAKDRRLKKAHARLTISEMVLLFDKVLDFALRKAGKDSDFSLKAQQKEIIETIACLKKLRMC